MYSSQEVLLFIGAIGTIAVNIVTAWKLPSSIDKKLTDHLNGREAKYIEQVAALQREIEVLRNIVVDKDKTAALLVKATNNRSRSTDSPENKTE